jgi:hypothetical protein
VRLLREINETEVSHREGIAPHIDENKDAHVRVGRRKLLERLQTSGLMVLMEDGNIHLERS